MDGLVHAVCKRQDCFQLIVAKGQDTQLAFTIAMISAVTAVGPLSPHWLDEAELDPLGLPGSKDTTFSPFRDM